MFGESLCVYLRTSIYYDVHKYLIVNASKVVMWGHVGLYSILYKYFVILCKMSVKQFLAGHVRNGPFLEYEKHKYCGGGSC